MNYLDTLRKAQYMLKLKITFFLASKANFVLLAISYFVFDSTNSFLIGYVALVTLYYKFLFSHTKMDNPYKIFLLDYVSKFLKNTRGR